MKYCPYCGADLADSAASFCMECGKESADCGRWSEKAKRETRKGTKAYGKEAPSTRRQSHRKSMKSLSVNTWEELFIQRTMDMTATMTMFCLQTQEN